MTSTSYGADIESADVMLLVGQKRFYAHRVKLAEKSCYFQAMFSSNMKECRQDIIELKEIGASSFDALIGYCYTNCCKVTDDNAYELLRASSMYNFSEVRQSCVDFLASRLDVTNCLEIMVLADSLSINNLHLSAKQVALWDFSVVRNEKEILELPLDILTWYLTQNDLRTESEVDVFETIVQWIAHDQSNRSNHFEELVLTAVRFSDIDHHRVARMWRSQSLNKCHSDCVVSRIKSIIEMVWRVKSGRLGSPFPRNSDSSEYSSDRVSVSPEKHTTPLSQVVDNLDLLEDENTNLDERSVEKRRTVSTFVDVISENYSNDQQLCIGDTEMDSTLDYDLVRSLLSTPPRAVQLVPAMVANFPNGTSVECQAPCLAHYDCNERDLVYQDTVTKAFQNSHIALGFRACIVGKYVYITGGEFTFGHNNWNFSIWKYDIFSKKWSFVTKLRNQRRHHILCVVGDCIYFIGGLGRFRVALNTAEKFDTITETWSDIAAMPETIFSAACAGYRDKIYVMQTNVYCYDIAANSWSQLKDVRLPHEHDFHSALAHPQHGIYLLGRHSKSVIKFCPDSNDHQDERDARYENIGELKHFSNCACVIGDTIYAFNTEDTLAESYDIRTGVSRVEETRNWSKTLGSANACYGCFAMPKYTI